jgi:hypothetical protein
MATTKKKRSEGEISDRVRQKIKPASEQPRNQHFAFYGEPGSGKTRLAASAPNCLIIDVDEQGTDSVRRDFDPKVFRAEVWQDVLDVYWYLQEGDHDFESFALDTLTGLNQMCLKFVLGDEVSRDASRDPDMPSRQIYGKVGKLMRDQITNFRNLGLNSIYLAQVRTKESGDDEDLDSTTTYGPDVSPSIAKHLDAAVGTIGYLVKREIFIKSKKTNRRRKEVRRRLLIGDSSTYISKDRNNAFGEYIDAPNLTEMLGLIYSE